MLCLAIGDSLGNPSESQLPAVRYNRNGEITDYILNRKAGDARGYPSETAPAPALQDERAAVESPGLVFRGFSSGDGSHLPFDPDETCA